jgi:NAD(P)H dehydrogenase (quinone)
MRVLVLYAHPVSDSYGSALHRTVVSALTAAGHVVDDCDLYAEGFAPVLTTDERRNYHNVSTNRGHAAREIERLLACEAIAFVFPTWWYGMPAILKGYIDRVWIPGVAFELVDGRVQSLLRHIGKMAVVTTYGSPWWLNSLVVGDPNRKVFLRVIRRLLAPRARASWLALHGLDFVGAEKRERFLRKVDTAMRAF